MLLRGQLAKFTLFELLFLFGLFRCKCDHNADSNNLNPIGFPLVVSTWDSFDFQAAAQKAFDIFWQGPVGWNTSSSYRRLNAIVEGLSECEKRRCDRTVGFGGSPDERGETTLDALVMDGPGHKSGAVAELRRIKSAAKVAWAVMNYTEHSLLAGEKEFALAMGFEEESLSTEESLEMHRNWLKAKCQPNFWRNVQPDPHSQCGPYKPNWREADGADFLSPTKQLDNSIGFEEEAFGGSKNHDTIGIVLVDSEGNVAAGTSSNGAKNKIVGRVGDAPIVGAGAFVDNEIGGAVATGDGDVMMRFVPSFLAVEQMRYGKSPSEATREAIERIKRNYPNFMGAVVAANVGGEFGAACSGIKGGFGYSVVNSNHEKVWVERVNCE
ncbi:hypothetical protein niasHS_002468 [Heterodera schachtii]|uniref:N(4)-(beta-N-acetylglucosaminyl)-L-asparaginase n=1 Tax=Heterodera schachtii TaxID=97005 RepID=A0ABD2KK14_HETSC